MVAQGKVRQWLHKEGLGTMVAQGKVRQWLHKETSKVGVRQW